MKILRAIIISFAVTMSAIVSIYVNRSFIFKYSANKLIKNLLPDYAKIKRLDFDFENKTITVRGLNILNPKGFRRASLIRIPRAELSYSLRDNKNIFKGITLSGIFLTQPDIYIERSKDGKINIQQNAEGLGQVKRSKGLSFKIKLLAALSYLFSPLEKTYSLKEIKNNLAKMARGEGGVIEIEPVLNTKDGSFVFDDRRAQSDGYKTTVEEIDARISLHFKKDLQGLDCVESEGSGFINGQKDQILNWVMTYDPKAPKLTMSNVLKLENVDLLHFQPYYDEFSPFVFKSGRASGELIFNFDDGNIDSTNELRLSTPRLEIKEGYPFRELWSVNTQDLYKYFTSQSGEIFFDFEIKGTMDQPKFSLGPKTRLALTKIVVDKIADALLGESGQAEDPAQKEKSFIQKIMDKYKDKYQEPKQSE